MKPRRLAFWLACLDVLSWLGLFGERPYLWCLERASDCIDWSSE